MRYLIIIVFAFYTPVCHAQFSGNKALYSRQNQLVFNTTTFIIPDGDKYLLEEYYGGGGMFWSGVFKDTLQRTGNDLAGNKARMYFKNGKYYIVYAGRKPKKRRFRALDTCHADINRYRNWHYSETLGYKLEDTLQKLHGYDPGDLLETKVRGFRDFSRNEERYSKYCHAEYMAVCDSMYSSLLQRITQDYLRRESRYNYYVNKTEFDAPYIADFLKDFTSCRFDQQIFYDLLINHTSLLLVQLNGLNEDRYRKVRMQFHNMPEELSRQKAMAKVIEDPGTPASKSRVLKDIKEHWRIYK